MDLSSDMIHEIYGLISDKTLCDKVIAYFEESKKRSLWQEDVFFSGRTLSPSEVEDDQIVHNLRVLLYKITQKVNQLYGEFVYPEFWDIVYWSPSMSMNSHVDDCNENLIQRHYTCICYLNDDYDGGQTFLPDHNYICKPEKEKVIVFPSNYRHGVNTVKKKSRYTLAIWFTRDENYLLDSM